MRYKPADHGPRVGRKWSDPVRAVILRAESALLPRGRGGAAGWSSARSSRCGKDPGPKVGPKGSISVRAVVLKRICIPPRGRGGAGWFQHQQLALRVQCGTSPCSIPHPNMSAPYPPPVRLPSPAGPEWPMRFPTSRPRLPLASNRLRICRFAGSAPPARKQVTQALQPRLHRGYG